MSTQVIDEKVVEMRFQNSQFEKGVKESMSTIERLKASLNFAGASKSFNQITEAADKVSFKGLEKNVDDLHNYINLKAMAMFTVVNNMVSQIQSSVTRMVKDFTIVPLSTGFNEYELKMGSVQTIMAATGESLETVNRYLEELNEYSDKTIYSFSDMTQNIGKFTNAGVKLEDAVLAMKGISNEAAVSGANANEASRAMYNLAQSLSMGYVQYIDWKSIENANMATVEFKTNLAETALQLGVLKKTTDGYYETEKGAYTLQQLFKDGMKDQWLTTDVLIGTLRDYADETTEIGKKAYAAAQDVKTFTMMMDTLKEAAQSGWAYTWEIFIGDFNEAKQMFTEFSNMFGKMIDESATARNNLLRGVLGSKWDRLIGYINEAGIATDEFEARLTRVLRESGYPVDEMVEKWGSLGSAIQHMGDIKDKVIAVIKSFTAPITGAGEAITDVTGRLDEFQNVVNKVIRGEFGSGVTRINELSKAGYNYAQVQKLINKVWERNGHNWSNTAISMEDLVEVMGEMSNEELKQIGFTEAQIENLRWLQEQAELTGSEFNELLGDLYKPSGRELIFDSIKNVVDAVVQRFQILKEAWRDVFPQKGTEELYGILEALHRFSEALILNDDKADKLKRTLRGIFSILGIVSDIIQTALQIFFPGLIKGVGAVEDGILGVTANLGDAIYNFRQFMKNGNLVADVLIYLRDSFFAGIQIIGAFIDKIREIPFLQGIINAVIEALKKLAEFAKEVFGDFYDGMLDTDSNMVEVFLGILDKISNKLKKIADSVPLIKDLREAFKLMFKDFKKNGKFIVQGFIEGLVQAIKDIPKVITDFASLVVDTFKDFMGIESPSKLFFKLAYYCIQGFLNGIFHYMSDVEAATNKLNIALTQELLGKEVQERLTKVKDFFKRIFDNTIDILIGFKDDFVGVVNVIKNTLTNSDIMDPVWKIAKDLVNILILFKTIRLMDNIGNGIADFGEGILKMGKAFQQVAKGIRSYFKSLGAKNYAKAIGTLALSVSLLMGVLLLMTKTMNESDIAKAKELVEPFKEMMIVFGAVAAGIVFVNGIAAKLGGNAKQLSKVVTSLALLVLAVGGSMWLISVTLEKLSNIDKTDLEKGVDNILNVVTCVSVMLMGISVLPSVVSGIASIFGGAVSKISFTGIGMAFLSIASSLIIIAGAFKAMDVALNSMKNPLYVQTVVNDILKILSICIGAIATFSALVGAKGGLFVGMGVAFLGVASSIIIMAVAMAAIDKAVSSLKHPIATLLTVVGILVAFGALTAVIGDLAVGMKAGPILAIAAVFLAFGMAVKAIARGLQVLNKVDIDPEAAVVMIFGIIGMFGMLALAIGILMGVNEAKVATATSTILAMAAMIAAVSFSVALLAKMIHDYDLLTILAAAGIVVVLLATIGKMMIAVSKVTTISGPGVASIIAIAAAIYVLAESLYKLKDVDLDQLVVTASALAGVIGVLEWLSQFMTAGWQGAVMLVAIGAAVYLVTDALLKLTQLPWPDMLSNMAKCLVIGLSLIGLTALALVVLSGLAAVGWPAVVLIIAIAGAIWLVSDAVVNLATHKDALTEFFEGPIKAIQGFIDKIKEAIQWLVDFDKKATEWIPGMKDYNNRRDKDKVSQEIGEAMITAWHQTTQGEGYSGTSGKWGAPTRSMPETYDRPLSRQKNMLPGTGTIQKREMNELTRSAEETGEAVNKAYTAGVTKPVAQSDATQWVQDYFGKVSNTTNSEIPSWVSQYKDMFGQAMQNVEFDPDSLDFLSLDNLGLEDINAQSYLDLMANGFEGGDYTAILESMGTQLGPNGNPILASIMEQNGMNASDTWFAGLFNQNEFNYSKWKNQMQSLSEGATSYWDYNLGTVIPVYSKDQVTSYNQGIANSSMMTSSLGNLAASSFGQTVQFPDTMNTLSPDVVNAVNGLKQDIANLGNRISNLYVRLDTGLMVGALTPAINQNMGRIAAQQRRWN